MPRGIGCRFIPGGMGFALLLWVVGCATPGGFLTTDPVGPIATSPIRHWGEAMGTLMVYTPTDYVDDDGIIYLPHRPYRIHDASGKLVKAVRNRVGLADQRPMTVPLDVGTYYVQAEAEGKGWVRVPVVIAANRLTVVNLEYRGLPEADAIPEAERVRLPDGRVIGRRAPLPSKPAE